MREIKRRAERLPATVETVARRIYMIRGQRVMLDNDLAQLYQVETKALNRQVKRNTARFPEDFMFQLTAEEAENLRCQNGTSSSAGGRRYLPYAFTEHGIAMLATALHSSRAVQMSVFIIRAFIRMREILAANRALAQKIEKLSVTQKQHEALFDLVIEDIKKLDQRFTQEIRLLKAPRRTKARIGFHIPREK
jgi:hypothetical protein